MFIHSQPHLIQLLWGLRRAAYRSTQNFDRSSFSQQLQLPSEKSQEFLKLQLAARRVMRSSFLKQPPMAYGESDDQNQNEGPTEIATWSLLEAISVDWFKGKPAENI